MYTYYNTLALNSAAVWNQLWFAGTASMVLWSEFLATERRCIVLPARYELNLYMLCSLIRIIKPRRMRWVGHVAKNRGEEECV
jgi:hypothetical protein